MTSLSLKYTVKQPGWVTALTSSALFRAAKTCAYRGIAMPATSQITSSLCKYFYRNSIHSFRTPPPPEFTAPTRNINFQSNWLKTKKPANSCPKCDNQLFTNWVTWSAQWGLERDLQGTPVGTVWWLLVREGRGGREVGKQVSKTFRMDSTIIEWPLNLFDCQLQ